MCLPLRPVLPLRRRRHYRRRAPHRRRGQPGSPRVHYITTKKSKKKEQNPYYNYDNPNYDNGYSYGDGDGDGSELTGEKNYGAFDLYKKEVPNSASRIPLCNACKNAKQTIVVNTEEDGSGDCG